MVTERELESNLNAFIRYNQERINRALQIEPVASQIGCFVAPLLFELNNKELPCYVESKEDYDVFPFFEATHEHIKKAERVIKNFKRIYREISGRLDDDMDMYRDSASGHRGKTLVLSLMIMGSIGSAAQNEDSDFDYWIIYDNTKINADELEYIKAKANAIEVWGDKQGVELHFFLTEVNNVRKNIFGAVDEDSVGSSQAGLLKEEFYRTAVLVAGRYPVWWVTPPSISDKEYDKIMEQLSASHLLDPSRFVNIGNIKSIPMVEFFGASLWQMNKAMESPFKSVLKMGMLESFIASHGKAQLLCDEIKTEVLNHKGNGRSPDPYLVLIDRLFGYYKGKKRTDVTELLSKCFYNKVHIKVSDSTRSKAKHSYKEDVILEYVENWGWSISTINDMNAYDEWSFDRMLKLGSEMHKFLLETYKNLTDDLKKKKQGDTIITKEDLTVLGNKLFAFYSRKKGKVELVKKATDGALLQESLTFHPIIPRGKKPIWTVLRGNVTTQIARKESIAYAEIKRGYTLAEIVSWMVLNKVINEKTFLHLVSSPLPIFLQSIQELIKITSEIIPPVSISHIDAKYLLSRPKTSKLLVIANFMSQTWAKNIEEITLVYRNTFGETFAETYLAKEGVARVAEIYHEALDEGVEDPHKCLNIFFAKGDNSHRLERTLRGTILSMVKKKKETPQS